MQLQNGAGSLRLNGTEEAVLHCLGLIFAVADQQNPFSLHDRADAHGIGMGRNILPSFEEALVSIDSGIGELDVVGTVDKLVAGLIKADVSIGT